MHVHESRSKSSDTKAHTVQALSEVFIEVSNCM